MNQYQWHILESLGNHNFESRIQINDFLTKLSSTGVKLSIEVLMKEIRPKLAEKQEFE